MPTIWITGAHGFIGRHLAMALAADGARVCGVGHGHWPESEARRCGLQTWINGSVELANLTLLRANGGVPDTVFHLAGGSSVGSAAANPSEDFRRTVVSTSELLEWLRLNSPEARLVAVSSAAIYGAAHTDPIAEDAATKPCSFYGTHKLMMEDLCRRYAEQHRLKVVLPRLFSVYGCGLRKQLLWDLCEKIASGNAVELGGTGNELRDWIEVRDVVRALKRLARIASAEAPAINLASGSGTTVQELAIAVAKLWTFGGRNPAVNFSGRSRPGDPFSLVADVRLMQGLLIHLDISPDVGIEDYVKWYRGLTHS